MDSKENLRQQVRQTMKTWWTDVNRRDPAMAAITKNMLVFLQNQKGLWGGFKSLPGEPCLDEAIKASQLRWVYPRVEDQVLSFWEPRDHQSFVKGAYGIQEPDPHKSQQHELLGIEGFIIPGLAFDRHGARLGKGKSFYDRALKEYSGLKVGVCFSWQVQEVLPTDSWDVTMDALITDAEILRFSSAKKPAQ